MTNLERTIALIVVIDVIISLLGLSSFIYVLAFILAAAGLVMYQVRRPHHG